MVTVSNFCDSDSCVVCSTLCGYSLKYNNVLGTYVRMFLLMCQEMSAALSFVRICFINDVRTYVHAYIRTNICTYVHTYILPTTENFNIRTLFLLVLLMTGTPNLLA